VIVQDGDVRSAHRAFLNEVEKKYDNVFLLRLENNQGLAVALNRGLEICSGKWIVRCDADDISLANRLSVLDKAIDSDIAVVSTYTQETDLKSISDLTEVYSNNFDPKKLGGEVKKIPLSNPEVISYSVLRNPVNHNSCAYRREVLLHLGGYPNIHLKEDYALWLKVLGANYKIKGSAEITVAANAGLELSSRRGGLGHFSSELRLFRFRRLHLPNWLFRDIFSFIIRCTFILVSARSRYTIYKYWLRT
jgi:glycosyltransferase involved in cell wall biosynthesis